MRHSFYALLAMAVAACAGSTRPPPPKAPSPPVAAAAVPKEQARKLDVAAVDAAIHDAWKAENVTPAPRADDATFLRRTYVDVVGTIPPPDVVTAFLADTAPDKRQKLVDKLLASPEYSEHWMNYWDDVLMGRDARGNNVDRVAFRYWLRARFEANAPWDRIVRDLVSATGQNSMGGARVNLPKALAMEVPLGTSVPHKGDPAFSDLEAINGAVNWSLRYEQAPLDLAGSASRVFLGVQIQCAQCHDHKTEKWKQDDFRRFASGFLHSRINRIDVGPAMGMTQRLELIDLDRVAPRFAGNPELSPVAKSKATALDGTDLEKGTGTRKALAEWMTSKENPWFARAIVNRMWGHFLGRGFTNPVDDMRASNPETMPQLLDLLAADFVANDYDLKHLIRVITQAEVYNLAASAGAKPDAENKLWARFHLEPLGPEELMNALLRATNVEATAERAGIKNLDQLRVQLVRQYAFLFDVDEEMEAPDYSGTVTQALALLNGQLTGQGSRALPGSALEDTIAGASDNDDGHKIDALYLRVLSRHPSGEELARWTNYVQIADKTPRATIPPPKKGGPGQGPLGRLGPRPSDPRRAAYEDVLWAMLNSSEFSFNH
jgi:hypothetical protein